MINKNIKNNQANCLQKLVCLLFLFLLISCQEERGCIDADDFGEYETYNFTVESSLLDKLCTYNTKIERESALQPCGIKLCLNIKINSSYKYDISECENACKNTSTSSLQNLCGASFKTAEPLWVSVGSALDKISIDPNSKILITAQGNLMLGRSSEKQMVQISNTHIGKENLTDTDTNLIKIGNENLNIFFNNKFTEGSLSPAISYFKNLSEIATGATGATGFSLTIGSPDLENMINNKLNLDSVIANGARKVFAYFLKYPDGMNSEYKKVHVPIFPHPDAWKPCLVSTEHAAVNRLDCWGECNNGDESQCGDYFSILSDSEKLQIGSSNNYKYNFHFTKLFNIKNDTRENSRFEDGTGFIISNEDNDLVGGTDVDPIPSITRNENLRARFTTFMVTPSSDYIYKFSSVGSSACPDSKIKLVKTNLSQLQSSGESKIINFDAEYELSKGYSYSLENPTMAECEIKIKPYPFHEIKFQNSGYVSFGIPKQFFESGDPLTDANVTNCRLKFKIINADGTEDFRNYGEYFGTIGSGGALTLATDPAPIVLPDKFFVKATFSGRINSAASANGGALSTGTFSPFDIAAGKFYAFTKTGPTTYSVVPIEKDGLQLAIQTSGVNQNVDTKFFVRKNQTIRFNPASWRGTWKSLTATSGGGTETSDVACGKGFYVKQIPRPAVFCTNIDVKEYRDVNENDDLDDDCKNGFVMDSSGTKRIGCDISISECSQYIIGSNYNPKYCPQDCIPRNYSNCNSNFDFTDSTEDVLNRVRSCTPSGEEKKCYNSLSHQDCDSSSNCATFANFLLIEPYKTDTTATATGTGTGGMSEAKCTACVNALKDQALKISVKKTSQNLKQCYDIEEYKGSLANLHTKLKELYFYSALTPSKAKLAYRLLEDQKTPTVAANPPSTDYSSLAGVKKIKTFDGTYGNFYPFKYSKDNLNNYPIYQLKDSISAIKDGYLKFIILPNVDASSVDSNEDKYFFSKTDFPTITSSLKINLRSVSDFSNGQQLAVNVCKEGDINGTKCHGDYDASTPFDVYDATNQFVNYFISADTPNNPHKIVQYLSTNTPKFSASSDNKYGFNNLGQLTRISDTIFRLGDCDQSLAPFIGANFLCFNAPATALDEGKYRLNFKIIDNETPNCKTLSSAAEPFQDCDFSSDHACDKYKVANLSYSPTSSSQEYGNQNTIRPDGEITTPSSSAKYFCVDNKYSNNSGYYDVSVKIKRDAKVKVSNFIDSIISPIMKEIDGDDQPTLNYPTSSAVEAKILEDNFYKEQYGELAVATSSNPNPNRFYHDYGYANNIVYPYFDSATTKDNPIDSGVKLINPAIDISNLKTMVGGDPSIVGIKTFFSLINASGNSQLTLYPFVDDKDHCSNNSCFIKYINVAVVASIDISSGAFSNYKKHCFVRSNRFDTRQRIKLLCANQAKCTINFNKNTFPLAVFSIKETDMALKYKDANMTQISSQPYAANPLYFNTNNAISLTSPISLIELEKKLDNGDCATKYLVVEYIYAKTVNPLTKQNQVKRLYNKILLNPVYKSFLTLSIVLMFSFYGLGFLMGVSELKQSEIVDRLIKIGIIYLFTNPSIGWVWFDKFFVTFFKNGTEFLTFLMASIFDDSGRIDKMLEANNFSDKSAIFGSVDKVVEMFLVNDVVHKKISALLFYKFFGIIYLMIIYYSAIAYVYAVSNAVLLYLTSQFFTSVLFLVGPFFFVFILFKQTKTFFDNWINSLIGFSLQQIFLVFTLTLFNSFLYLIIKLNLGYAVCWDDVWKVPIGNQFITLFSFWTPQDSPSIINSSVEINSIGSSMPTLPKVLSLWTVCVLMQKFISSINDLAATLSGGMSATELGSSLSSGITKIIESKKEGLSNLYKKSGLNLVARADQKLFDSGQLAKNARKQALAKDKEEQRIKEKMLKDGNKAVSKYKVENAEKFSKMSEEEKRKTLTQVKQNAMRQSAVDMGKTSGQIDKLMNDKSGVKYQGDNVFGLVKSVATNKLKDTNSSLNEKSLKVDTGMSKKEMEKAIKNTQDPDKRKELIANIAGGNINKSADGKALANFAKQAVPVVKFDRGDVSFKERSNAIKELEKSGQISKQNNMFEHNSVVGKINKYTGVGSSMTNRSAKDEEKIIAKIQENRLAQTVEKGPNMSAKEINKLNSFEKRLEQKEAKLSPEERLGEKEKSLEKRTPKQQNIDREADSKRLGGNIEKLKEEKNKNDGNLEKAKEGVKESQDKLENFNKNMSPKHLLMDKLNKDIQNGWATNDDIKSFASLKREDDVNNKATGQDFKSKMQERAELEKDLGSKENVKNNLEKKGENIDKAIDQTQKEKNKVEGKTDLTDPALSDLGNSVKLNMNKALIHIPKPQ